MLRKTQQPRKGWQKTVESQGLVYHTCDGVPYWDESVYYQFSLAEIEQIEQATYALDAMCLKAVEHVIGDDLFARFEIPEGCRQFVADSWETDEHTIYGRFDLAFDGAGPPKLLEFNADTPTAILEAAVIQWYWLKDCYPEAEQFNSIHERLLEVFQTLRGLFDARMHFAAVAGNSEDFMTVSYLRDLAIQAGFETAHIAIEQIGWDPARGVFTDETNEALRACFKLYPWEWLFREEFGPHLPRAACRWFEPPWKSILSNKALLPLLWELFPDSPYLLRATTEAPAQGRYVKKPLFGREGANIAIYEDGKLFFETDGPYDGPCIFQEFFPLPRFEQRFFPIVGSWLVNGWACGIGIREDENLITGNLSRFVPHRME